MKSKSASMKVLVILTLIALTFAYLLPIYVTVINSLKSIQEINSTNYLTPVLVPKFENYAEVLFGSDRFRSEMLPRLGNSLIITFAVTLLSAFFGGLEDQHGRAIEVARLGQIARRAHQNRGVAVMTATVHQSGLGRLMAEVVVFCHRQRVHVGA